MSQVPDALVLGGGGVLGEAWLTAVLAGLESAGEIDARRCRLFLGTSAGSIVAASLAAGYSPRSRLRDAGEHPGAGAEPIGDAGGPQGRVRAVRAGLEELTAPLIAPLASLALGSSAGGGALLRRTILARVPAGRRSHAHLIAAVERSGARFDGRLLIAALDASSGCRVVFGAEGAPAATVAQAVAASCAIPGVFAPVRVGGRDYVDGGAWSPTNMDALPVRRGEHVLCLNPTGSLRPQRGSLAGAFGPLSRAAGASEALALRHRGARVTLVHPDGASAEAMGIDLMNPARRAAVISAGYAQGLALAGGREARAA